MFCVSAILLIVCSLALTYHIANLKLVVYSLEMSSDTN